MSSVIEKIKQWFRSNEPGDPVKLRVIELVHAADTFDASGEYKRHRVYAQLLKEFPNLPHRDLAYLIELVLQEDK